MAVIPAGMGNTKMLMLNKQRQLIEPLHKLIQLSLVLLKLAQGFTDHEGGAFGVLSQKLSTRTRDARASNNGWWQFHDYPAPFVRDPAAPYRAPSAVFREFSAHGPPRSPRNTTLRSAC